MTSECDGNSMGGFFGPTFGMAGCDWVNYNSLGLNFQDRLVQSKNYNELVKTPMYELLLARNHNNGQSGEVLDESVVDFVYQVGKFHGSAAGKAALAGLNRTTSSKAEKFLNTMLDPSGNLRVATNEIGETLFWDTIPLVPDTVTGYVDGDAVRPWGSLNSSTFLRDVYKAGFNQREAGSYVALVSNVLGVSMPSVSGMPSVSSMPSVSGAPLAEIAAPDSSLASAMRAIAAVGASPVPLGTGGKRRKLYGGAIGSPKGWNFNAAAFLRNVRECATRNVPSPKYGDASSCDELNLYDMATGVNYGRDEKGLFRVSDGNKVYVSDMGDAFAGKCLGVDLNCESDLVANCLLSGSPLALSKCLATLGSASMWNVAQSEVNKLHPAVIVKVLTTFGFKIEKYSDGVSRPLSFDDWKEKVLKTQVTQEVREKIEKNVKLMNYLKALVSIVRDNPVVLDCNQVTQTASSYATKAGIKPFVPPVFTSPKVTPNIMDQGILLSGPSLPLALNIQNVMRMPQMMGLPLGVMGGGAQPQCINAELLRKTFNNLFTQMERKGKVLVDEDKAKVLNAINRVENLENELTRLMDDVKLFTKLSETYSLNPVPVKNYTLQGIKSDAEEKRNEVVRTLSALTDSSTKSISELNTLLQSFTAKVIPALNSILLGQPSQYVTLLRQ